MGKSKFILIIFAHELIPRRIIYYGGVHLCTPYRARPEACTNCRAQGHRYDVGPQQKKPQCPRCTENHGEDRSQQCVPRCILCGGKHLTGIGWCKAKQRQVTMKPPVHRDTTTETLPGESSSTQMNSQHGSRQHRQWPLRSSHGQNESPVNETIGMWSWPTFERR